MTIDITNGTLGNGVFIIGVTGKIKTYLINGNLTLL